MTDDDTQPEGAEPDERRSPSRRTASRRDASVPQLRAHRCARASRNGATPCSPRPATSRWACAGSSSATSSRCSWRSPRPRWRSRSSCCSGRSAPPATARNCRSAASSRWPNTSRSRLRRCSTTTIASRSRSRPQPRGAPPPARRRVAYPLPGARRQRVQLHFQNAPLAPPAQLEYWAAYPVSGAQTQGLLQTLTRAGVVVTVDQQSGKAPRAILVQFLLPILLLVCLFALFMRIGADGGAGGIAAFSEFTGKGRQARARAKPKRSRSPTSPARARRWPSCARSATTWPTPRAT